MFRVAIIGGAALLSILYAPAPDPRIVSALGSAAKNADSRLPDSPEEEYYCPMDLDVRSPEPGYCRRCGMRLIKGIRDVTPYLLNLDVETPLSNQPDFKHITFEIRNPKTGKLPREFEIVHEKLYHLFVVSQDLTFFLHTHPERRGNEDFHLDIRFPRPGTYRLLSDFYPQGGGPQLLKSTVTLPGPASVAPKTVLRADLLPKTSENARVEMEISPSRITTGQKASLIFRVAPSDGLEPYLGVMAHMLAASENAIDLIHNHPSQVYDEAGTEYEDLVFRNMVFARAGLYRVWIQFQRLGVVNTAFFDIQVGVSE